MADTSGVGWSLGAGHFSSWYFSMKAQVCERETENLSGKPEPWNRQSCDLGVVLSVPSFPSIYVLSGFLTSNAPNTHFLRLL
jgi:hypothetical protein